MRYQLYIDCGSSDEEYACYKDVLLFDDLNEAIQEYRNALKTGYLYANLYDTETKMDIEL